MEKQGKILANMNETEIRFINETIDPLNFKIVDVDGDNSCFYRCIANILHSYTGEIFLDEIIKMDKIYNLNLGCFDFHNEYQEIMSIEIRKLIAKWIYLNKNKYIPELDLKVKDLLINTHSFLLDFSDIDENIKLEDFLVSRYCEIYTDDNDEFFDKWGGAVEQYAISQIFKLPIFVYVYKKYNKRFNRIENGKIRNNKAEKGVRFKLYQCFGNDFDNKNSISILYRNTRNCPGHYMTLFNK